MAQNTSFLKRVFHKPSPTTDVPKFGTLNGVFLPTLLTILGAVMYLRTGWVVGNAGLLGGLLIILLANFITISTGLSVSTIATNIRVRAGGAFSIISQSLGLEVGGSVTVPFYLAQAISVTFYVFAFSEGWALIFPTHPAWLVVSVGFLVCFTIAWVSVSLAVRVRYFILTIVALSLISVALGLLPQFGGITQPPTYWGNFPGGNFWAVFAVFFPAVTGLLTGVNMSGTLKDPRRSIPLGMLSAMVLTMFIYLGLAYWASLVATPEELVNNLTIMVDRAAFGPIVLAGILAATFSAALNSLVGAPRILQAIAEHRVLPGSAIFAQETASGEPRPAMYLTGLIGIVTIVFGVIGGGLNAIAPLMTMFFLITYTVLNGVVALEQLLGLVSFRPLLQVPRWVPVAGVVGCVVVMFLIAPIFSLVAIVVTILLYAYLSRRQLHAPWSDVRSGLFVTLAEWAAKRVILMPSSQERAWKPSLLVPTQSYDAVLGSYRFLRAITYPRGSVHILGLYPRRRKEQLKRLMLFAQDFANDGVFARVALVESANFTQNVQTGLEVLHGVFFRPNILFMPVRPDTKQAMLQTLLDRGKENNIGTILYAKHPETSLGREQTINVWIRDQSPDWEVGLRLSNLDLSLLLAYQLARNWQGCITLIMIISDPAEQSNAQAFLTNLITLGRMPRHTQAIVKVGTFNNYVPHAPQADLQIFGLQEQVELDFVHRMVLETRSSCIFVHDSGNESALA